MLEDVLLKNVTTFRAFASGTVSNVNLGIRENDTGTSNLLRMLCAVSRSVQEFTRMDDAPTGRWSELPDKTLQWTFQLPELELGKNTTSEIRKVDAGIETPETGRSVVL